MTEHGASIFVFFFLGEYSSLILMSTFMAVFFLGGYHCPDLYKIIIDPIIVFYYFLEKNLPSFYTQLYHLFYIKNSSFIYSLENFHILNLPSNILDNDGGYIIKFDSRNTIFEFINILIDKLYGSYVLGIKIIIVVFFYIWVRSSFPRLRYDQLMALCWKELLPLVFAYLIFSICLFYTFDLLPFGIKF
jgi:NADH-ubiquinone oxidoreductase chain 1